MSKRKDRMEQATKSKDQMDLTSMIDVTFLLLIFFICTLKYKRLEGKLTAYLPKDMGVNTDPSPPIEKLDIRIDVTNEGTKVSPLDPPVPFQPGVHQRFRYQGRTFSIQVGIQKFNSDNMEALAARLRDLASVDKERPVTIDPRRGVVTEDVVKVLDLVLDAKFEKVSFAGSYEK